MSSVMRDDVLPFNQYSEEISEAIKNNAVTIITMNTGSGKSICAPVVALEATGKESVITANPTIMAVKALRRYQQQLQDNKPPTERKWKVAYAAGGDIQYTKESNIIYTTTGHLNKRIIQRLAQMQSDEMWQSEAAIDFTDILIIDESHIPSNENYILLHLMVYILKKQVHLAPKIIITSATMNIEEVTTMFQAFNPCVLQYEHPKFPVTTQFHSVDYQLFTDIKLRQQAAVKQTLSILQSSEERPGDILIFAAGSQQVEDVIELLYAQDPTQVCLILRAYASLSVEELDLVTVPLPPDSEYRCKIIVSTNIAESSVTIDGVVHIIDLMLEKVQIMDASGAITLSVKEISKSSSIQRRGRAGRTQPGVYYPLCTEAAYQQLAMCNESEFLRTPIYTTVIEFLDAGINAVEILNIPKLRYSQTLQELLQLKMIEKISNANIVVTDAGRYCTRLPIFLRNAYWIYLIVWDPEEQKAVQLSVAMSYGITTLDVAIILICILEVVASQPIFWIPKRERDESINAYNERIKAHKIQYLDRFRGQNDMETLLNIYLAMIRESYDHRQQHKPNDNTSRDETRKCNHTEWSTMNSMNNRVLVQIRQRIHRLCEHLQFKDRMKIWSNESKCGAAVVVNLDKALAFFIRAYPDHVCTRKPGYGGVPQFTDSNGKVYGVNNRNHLSLLTPNNTTTLGCYCKSQVQTLNGKMFYLLNYIFEIKSTHNIQQHAYTYDDSDEEDTTDEDQSSDDYSNDDCM